MKKAILILAFSIFIMNSYSQNKNSINLASKWQIELSILAPIAKIYLAEAVYQLWQHKNMTGKLLLGLDFQNWDGDNTGQQEAYSLIVGYRQYFWKGLHVDYQFIPDYAFFHSSIDSKTYEGLNIWHELRIGYKFNFKIFKKEFYVLTQMGFGREVYTQNPWPDFERDAKLIPTPNLWLGIVL